MRVLLLTTQRFDQKHAAAGPWHSLTHSQQGTATGTSYPACQAAQGAVFLLCATELAEPVASS